MTKQGDHKVAGFSDSVRASDQGLAASAWPSRATAGASEGDNGRCCRVRNVELLIFNFILNPGFYPGSEKKPVSQKRERQKGGFLGGLEESILWMGLWRNWMRVNVKMHFSGVILLKLTIPVAEKREFDEKRDFFERENRRAGGENANVYRGLVKNGLELEK